MDQKVYLDLCFTVMGNGQASLKRNLYTSRIARTSELCLGSHYTAVKNSVLSKKKIVIEDCSLCFQIGKIYEMRMMMDFNGNNRGYAFITFSSKLEAKNAIRQLNNYEIR